MQHLPDPAGFSPGRQGQVAPAHLAIIMDGNGRWATQRGLPRAEGHRRGVEALRRIVRAMGPRGIRHLTIYSFSTENWKRPKAEVTMLMSLMKRFIEQDLAELHGAGVRIRIIGERESLAGDIRALIERAESVTRDNRELSLNIAFNYGSRDELQRAVQKLAADVAAGRRAVSDLTEAAISDSLDTAGQPDPDLVIRTSGEHRISNFLLWQAAYAEFVFSQVLWPDFDEAALDAALAQFAQRDRRYGGLAAQAV
jgi:undecaprenyl diphosphate synthase